MLFECLRFQNVVYVACFLPFFFPVVSFSEGMLVFPVIMHIFINYWQNTLACMHCGVVNIYVQLDHESCLTAFKLKMEICRESTNTTERVALCYRSFLSDFLFFFFAYSGLTGMRLHVQHKSHNLSHPKPLWICLLNIILSF